MDQKVKLLMVKVAERGSDEGALQHLEDLINAWIEANTTRKVTNVHLTVSENGAALYAMVVHAANPKTKQAEGAESEEALSGIATPEERDIRLKEILGDKWPGSSK